MPKQSSRRSRVVAAALVAAACVSAPLAAVAGPSAAFSVSNSAPAPKAPAPATTPTPAPTTAPFLPAAAAAPGKRHQLDVCSLHYATDSKRALASMELSYARGRCVVAARTVAGGACSAQATDTAVLLGPFDCEAPVTLSAVSARLAADSARRSAAAAAAAQASSPSLSGPGLNAWLTVGSEPSAAVNAWLTVTPAAASNSSSSTGGGARDAAALPSSSSNTTLAAAASPSCMLTLQEPTKLLRAPGGTLGSGGRAPYVRGAYTLTGMGCRAGVDPSRASVDAAADALLGAPAEQRLSLIHI